MAKVLESVVSEASPLAIVYPGSSFLAPYFIKELLRLGCQALTFEEWQKNPGASPAYIFELDSLGELLGLAKKNRAKYLAIIWDGKEAILEKAERQGVDGRGVSGRDIYGPGMDLLAKGPLAEMLYQALFKGAIRVAGQGSLPLYPLFAQDFAAGACRAMIEPGTTGKAFSFFGQPIATIALAHLIKEKAKKEIEIEFVSGEASAVEEPDPEEQLWLKKELSWQPTANLEERLTETGRWLEENVQGLREEPEEKPEEKPKAIESYQPPPPRGFSPPPPPPPLPLTSIIEESFAPATTPEPSLPKADLRKLARRFLVFFLFFFFVFSLLLLAPLGMSGVNAYRGFSLLKSVESDLRLAKFALIEKKTGEASRYFSESKKWASFSQPVFETLGFGNELYLFDDFLSLGNHLAGSVKYASRAGKEAADAVRLILDSEKVEIGPLWERESALLDKALVEAGLAETLVSKERLPKKFLFLDLEESLGQIADLLPKARALLAMAKESGPILTSVFEGRKTYLVLLQNNMELRPTGGFIGSFGLASFDQGRFLDFGVSDVYVADGQLKGHVEPPEKLKEYLGEAGWYLRDANWDPDFPTSSRRVAWFLEKEMGRTVNGVIGINLNFAKEVLRGLGPVYLPDYQEKIDEANLFERAEYRSEIGTFPGSTQKSDFLGSLASALFEKLRTGSEKELFAVAKGAYKALEAGDFLVYLDDPTVMEKIAKFGWSGEIRSSSCQHPAGSTVKCLSDYLMLVEANLGVNKANYFLRRRIDQKIGIAGDGSIEHRLKIDYQNTAETNAWPAGKYKNYLRAYVPQNSRLVTCQIDGVLCQVDESSEHERKIFGLLVEVPIGEKKTVEISYELPEKFPQEDRASFAFTFQRQSGTAETPNTVLISFPQTIKPLLISPAGVYSPGSLLFADLVEKSRTYRAEFVRQD